MVDETGAGASSRHRQEPLLLAMGILRALVSEKEAVELLTFPIFIFRVVFLAVVSVACAILASNYCYRFDERSARLVLLVIVAYAHKARPVVGE